ncbi:flavodoxin-like fold protein [Taxawa tesnikishii (nom. ined.)]|nr:flavodoxin-like fold protein [Dothideales sp. JES 119]
MAPKIAIVFYSMYGHVQKLAEAEAEGIRPPAVPAISTSKPPPRSLPSTIYRTKTDLAQGPRDSPGGRPLQDARSPKSNIPVLHEPKTLEQYDGFLFGIPTRYGNYPAQFKAFWDHTGAQWQTGAFWGKYAGLFVSTGTLGGGQESTAIAAMSTLAHHGFIYVPLGYKTVFGTLADLTEVRGGSPWGAGTFAGGDGSRQPTEKELLLATEQGKAFYQALAKVNFSA